MIVGLMMMVMIGRMRGDEFAYMLSFFSRKEFWLGGEEEKE
jgi:hypothetical protein